MKWEDFDSGTMFWGKLSRPDKTRPPVAWHPLEDHCVDVASCAEALLTRTLLGNRLATLASQASLHPGQVARLCVLAGLHDVGKYNHGFQAKDGRGGWICGHVSEGLTVIDALSYRGGPKQFCREVCAALQVQELSKWSADGGATIINLLVASICHHGRIVQSDDSFCRFQVFGERDPVKAIGELLYRLLQMFPDALGDNIPPLPPTPAFQHAFMGLMVLADWLGSDTRSFPYSELGDAPREDAARAAAARVLRETWLDADRSALGGAAPPFSVVAGARAPRPVQEAVGSLGAASGPSCVVLEAETGSGKTEAALVRFFSLYAAGEVDGMFFALPTRAAARQIYLRVLESVRRVFPADETPPVILAVPGYLDADGVRGKRGETPDGLPSFDVLWPDEPADQRRWAAENSKRFLSGAVVVGTVDQALLGVLDVSHGHLRATSLLRQLLVVDEVHASDEYMTELLAELLRHQLGAGGHAMVMSATCGGEARARLLGDELPTQANAIKVPYPRVEHRSGAEVRTVEFDVSSSKTVYWDVRELPELSDVVGEAVEAARAGARVVFLRNTVSGALEAQAILEARATNTDLLFKCRGVPTLHHGRYATGDRHALDEALEQRFREPGGLVVVSTQTLEQSLDIDADLLITDLCPADVLIQRVGRLHRHDRPRPEGFIRARCVLLSPAPGQLYEAATLRTKLPCGWGLIYENLDVLELTRRTVTSRASHSFPLSSRAFVESALHSEARKALLAESSSWAPHVKDRLSASWKSRRLAELSCADWSIPVGKTRPRDNDAPRRLTRLGDGQDRLLRLREPQPSPFPGAPPVRWITLPHWAQVPYDQEEVIPVPKEPGRFEFTVGNDLWAYSRTGLQFCTTNTPWRKIK